MLDTKTSIHLHQDDLELYARGRLEPEFTQVSEKHLLACEICQETLADCLRLGLAIRAAEKAEITWEQKRAEPRFVANGEATLQEASSALFGAAQGQGRKRFQKWPRNFKPKSYFSRNDCAIAAYRKCRACECAILRGIGRGRLSNWVATSRRRLIVARRIYSLALVKVIRVQPFDSVGRYFGYSKSKATKLMMEVHEDGKSVAFRSVPGGP